MSDIQELRSRVEATASAFGAVGNQQETHRQRLVDVMHAVDAALRRKQTEVIELRDENAQLRQLLDVLLAAAEAGSDDRVGGAIADLDVAVAAFADAVPTGAPAAPTDATPADATPADAAPAEAAPAEAALADDLHPAWSADALGDGAADVIDELNGDIPPTEPMPLPEEPAPAVLDSAVPDGGEPAIPVDDDPVAELTALLDGDDSDDANIDPVAIAEEAVRAATEAIEAGDDMDVPPAEAPAAPAADEAAEPTVREIMERVDKLSRELNPDGPAAETG